MSVTKVWSTEIQLNCALHARAELLNCCSLINAQKQNLWDAPLFLQTRLYSMQREPNKNNKISMLPVSQGNSNHSLQQMKTFPPFCRTDVANALFSLVPVLHKRTFFLWKRRNQDFSVVSQKTDTWVGKLSRQISAACAPLRNTSAQGTHLVLPWSALKILLSHRDHRPSLMVHK